MSGRAEVGAALATAPSLSRRMASFVYEGLILFGILLIPGAIGAALVALTHQQNPLRFEAALPVLSFAIYAVYFTWFWSARGQTLPMQTWHIRVVTVRGAPLSRPRALFRYLASYAWFAPAFLVASANGWTLGPKFAAIGVGVLGYALLALLHPQRQFWHDALCGTRLISERSASAA